MISFNKNVQNLPIGIQQFIPIDNLPKQQINLLLTV
jgi:hypothetical protein